MIIGTHELAPTQFDALATGGGGPDAIVTLRRAQLSKHRMLISRLARHWPGPAVDRDAAVALLDRARAADGPTFDDVLSAPLVGAWTAIVNRAVEQDRTVRADFDHLGGLAAVVGRAAGVDGETVAPVRRGAVALPGLGVALVATAARQARVVVHDGQITVHAGQSTVVAAGPDRDDWQAVRSLSSDPARRLDLDDVDPYRHGHHAPPAPRLSAVDFERWRERYEAAWTLLAAHVPTRAAELSAGLHTLVPLVQADERSARSATIRHAFGVFGLTLPATAADFAVTLVHEFQHSKLSAILDLVALSEPTDRRFFAPWRLDPRPLAGLIQGVYAFVGVAETWQALRAVPELESTAQAEFAEARLQVDRGLTSVEKSDALTEAGHALVGQLRRTTDQLLNDDDVPADIDRAARRALDETYERWVERNGSNGYGGRSF